MVLLGAVVLYDGAPVAPIRLQRTYLLRDIAEPPHFQLNGRLAGGFWMNLPKGDRHRITISERGHGEIAFGALQAGLDIAYARTSIGFTWRGCDEMDEVFGDGYAQLLDDGSLEIEFAYHNGDDAVLKARREPSSTAC